MCVAVRDSGQRRCSGQSIVSQECKMVKIRMKQTYCTFSRQIKLGLLYTFFFNELDITRLCYVLWKIHKVNKLNEKNICRDVM